MKIAILGNGVEGRSVEAYFRKQPDVEEIKIYDDFAPEELDRAELEGFDLVFRSPSVSPNKLPKLKNLTTVTRYFFERCPARIIGVTGTKGKGTTCSITVSILKEFGEKVHLLGNIGKSAITELPKVKENDVVVYEMSSFQLWDLDRSPQIAGILRVEPDHLNIHDDFEDYVLAKGNIAKFQAPEDYLVYYRGNSDTAKIANLSPGVKVPYPAENTKLEKLIRENLKLPGEHNVENAEAAVTLVSSFYGVELEEFLRSRNNCAKIKEGLAKFEGLPHRLQFIRELNGVRYYNDNYSTNLASLDVALAAFPEAPIILIVGGSAKDTDEGAIRERIFGTKNLKKAILIGETKEALAEKQNPRSYICAETLPAAVETARDLAESYADDYDGEVIVLMSPAHASFDMFENATDRGNQFTKLVKKLK